MNPKSRTQDKNYNDLKHFVGRRGAARPNILIKSDAAREIVGAIADLGWLPEPSLQNRFPHNSVHERWIGTLKSTVRASILQSGFPEVAADWAVPYSSLTLAFDQPWLIFIWYRIPPSKVNF